VEKLRNEKSIGFSASGAAASPKAGKNRPIRLRPFCSVASLRVGRGGNPASSLRLANPQNDSQFFIPYFFHSLLIRHGRA